MQTLTDRTIGEIAAENVAAIGVFERFGIDYCCGGRRPLSQACREAGITVGELESALNTLAAPPEIGLDWHARTLTDLQAYLVGRFPIRVMLAEHEAVGDLPRDLRANSDGYTPPGDACFSYRELYRRLDARRTSTFISRTTCISRARWRSNSWRLTVGGWRLAGASAPPRHAPLRSPANRRLRPRHRHRTATASSYATVHKKNAGQAEACPTSGTSCVSCKPASAISGADMPVPAEFPAK